MDGISNEFCIEENKVTAVIAANNDCFICHGFRRFFCSDLDCWCVEAKIGHQCIVGVLTKHSRSKVDGADVSVLVLDTPVFMSADIADKAVRLLCQKGRKLVSGHWLHELLRAVILSCDDDKDNHRTGDGESK